MARAVLVLCLFLTVSQAFAGRPVRLSSPGFSVVVSEPEGWVLDVSSAAQVSHVVLYEKGKNWREAEVVIFGRFISRSPDESRDDFVESEEEKFNRQCAFGDISREDLDLQSAHDFLVKFYDCPGFQSEIVAVAEVPSFFVVFTLTAQTLVDPRTAVEPFKEVLNEFRWIPRESLPRILKAEPPPH